MCMATKVNRELLAVRLDVDAVEELRKLAVQFGYDSHNQVAAEILTRYKKFWVAAKEAEAEALRQQEELLLGKAHALQPQRARKKA